MGTVRKVVHWAIAAVLLLLASASPALASVEEFSLATDTVSPGESVAVSATFGATDWTNGEVTVAIFLDGSASPATLSLPAQPGWAAACFVGDTGVSVLCGWIPRSTTDTVRLDVQLTIPDTAPAGTLELVAESVVLEPTPNVIASQRTTVTVTEPPVTEPPATEPPVTEPPVTEPPATETPVTEPPASGTPAEGELPTEAETPMPTVVEAGGGGSPRGAPPGLLALGALALLAAGGAAVAHRARSQAA